MIQNTPIANRIPLVILASFLLWVAGFMALFGYRIMKEDATSPYYGLASEFRPDTSWLGLSLLASLAAAYVISRVTNKPLGHILSILMAIWGVTLILAPRI